MVTNDFVITSEWQKLPSDTTYVQNTTAYNILYAFSENTPTVKGGVMLQYGDLSFNNESVWVKFQKDKFSPIDNIITILSESV